MACYIGTDLNDGLDIFREAYKTSGDFVMASNAALESMSKAGFDISKEEFNSLIESRFKDMIPKSESHFRYRGTKKQAVLGAIHKKLGIVGAGAKAKVGKFTAGKFPAEVQQELENIIDFAFKGKAPTQGLSNDAEVIGTLIKDGILYDNIPSLQEALRLINEMRDTGTTTLTKRAAEQETTKQENIKKVVGAVSHLNAKQQEVKDSVVALKEGNADPAAVVEKFRKIYKFKGPIDMSASNEELAGKLLMVIANKENPLKNSWFKGVKKRIQDLGVWENFDLGSLLNLIDRRGSKDIDGGFLETFIHDNLRKASDNIRSDKDKLIEHLGKGLGKILGVDIKAVKGLAGAFTLNKINKLIQAQAIASNKKMITKVILPDNTQWEPTKGEVAQLWLDSFDPDLARSIEAAGVSMEDLRGVWEQLSEKEQKFAVFMQQEFYPYIHSQENPVHEKVYNTSIPFNQVYGGNVSYTGDAVKADAKLSPVFSDNFKQTKTALSNDVERGPSPRAIDLKRNIFVNAVQRIDTSSKFTGGAEIFNTIQPVWNSSAVRDAVGKATYSGGIHKKVNERIDSVFGLNKKLGGVPAVINNITGNVTFTSLAFTPKLMLNQITSFAFWLTEGTTFSGLRIGAKYHAELSTGGPIGILNSMFDNSPILRERYKRSNLASLSSSIEDAETGMQEIIDRGGSQLAMIRSYMSFIAMSPTLLGDAGGVLLGGTQYYKGEYAKARKAGKSIEEAREIAGYKFGKKLSKTQQSFQKLDKSDLQNSDLRIFTMFQTSPRQFRRLIANNIRQLARTAQGKEAKGSIGKHVISISMFHFFGAAAYKGVMEGLPALLDWDEDDEEEYVANILTGSWINSVAFLGDALEYQMNAIILNNVYDADKKTDWKVTIAASPAFQKLDKAYQSLEKVLNYYQNDDDRLGQAFYNFSGESMEAIYGVPFKKASLNIDRNGNWAFDEAIKNFEDAGPYEKFLRAMRFSDYQIASGKGEDPYGSKTNKKKGFKKKGFKKKGFKKKKGFD